MIIVPSENGECKPISFIGAESQGSRQVCGCCFRIYNIVVLFSFVFIRVD